MVSFAGVGRKSELDILLDKVQKFTTRTERGVIKKAYHMSEEAHKEQLRKSGEPYFIHPVQVAFILSEMNLDYQCICAGLLHDVLEDTQVSKEYLLEEFGHQIADLVDAVTKLSSIKSSHNEISKVNNIRKMILATVKDGRVILIKLADRLHNMRTLSFLPEAKMRRIAQETLDIYAPLAGRFGLYKIKWELEDLCLYHLDQNAYQQIKASVAEKRSVREENLQNMIVEVQQRLKSEKIKATVEGRPKHFYSIYEKMKNKNKTPSEIYDLTGIRILLNSVQECYTVMGVIHNIWTPFPGRFKDYISVPKSNGYQSLHTTVVGHDGKHMEFQIRTRAMHLIAEVGIAAHWAYKENKCVPETDMQEAYRMLDNIASLDNVKENAEKDASRFMQELKENLTSKEVYVFTPKGDIIALPKESTVLDLAFRIHTDLGLKCAGGKIEGRLVSIRTQLKSGDQVQIITNSSVRPSMNWLNLLRTSHARNKLKAWFRKQEGIEITETAVNLPTVKEEKKSAMQDESAKKEILLIPEKLSHKRSSKKNKKEEKNKSVVLWEGESNFISHYAQCCNPVPGDPIYGFITKVNGVSIHKKDCSSLKSLMLNPATRDRVVALSWSGFFEAFQVSLAIEGKDRSGIFLEIVKSLTAAGSNILKVEATTSALGELQDIFTIEVDSMAHLNTIMESIQAINSITSVKQVQQSGKKKSG